MLSKNIDHDQAFDEVINILYKRFELDMIAKDSGYLRTKWKYNWTSNGQVTQNYRVRVTVKLSKQRNILEINAEAEKLIGRTWYVGTDTQLLETVKRDLSGVLGS
jgi:hypothetical protein